MNRHFSAITGGMLLPMWIFANAVVATLALPSLITTDIEDAQVVKIPVPIRCVQCTVYRIVYCQLISVFLNFECH